MRLQVRPTPDGKGYSLIADADDLGSQMITGRPFRALLAVENYLTGDNRYFGPGCFVWRDLPLPLMGLRRTTEAHMDAILIGSIHTIERVGDEVWATGTLSDSMDLEVVEIIGEIDTGHLRGVSVDMDYMEMDVEYDAPAELDIEPDDDGKVRMPYTTPKLLVSQARIMGATVVPFPAIEDAHINLRELVASGSWPSHSLVATGRFAEIDGTEVDCDDCAGGSSLAAGGDSGILLPSGPIIPPASWYQDPKFSALSPLTVSDSGQVSGHLGGWDQCHIGLPGCVKPPRSLANYAHFLTGEILTDSGDRIAVGQITVGAGHAPLNASAQKAREHYDSTGWAGADVTIGEDVHGPWIAGSLSPDITPAQVRRLMASAISGDWRQIRGNLELVAIASVNVPGFNTPRTYMANGLVASLMSAPMDLHRPDSRKSESEARAVRLIAQAIGRDRDARLASLAQRVHGGS